MSDEENKNSTKEQLSSPNTFSKEQLTISKRFQENRDLLNALLVHDKRYTIQEAEQMIEQYKRKEVR